MIAMPAHTVGPRRVQSDQHDIGPITTGLAALKQKTRNEKTRPTDKGSAAPSFSSSGGFFHGSPGGALSGSKNLEGALEVAPRLRMIGLGTKSPAKALHSLLNLFSLQ